MGMIVSLSSLRDATIGRLLADPPLVWQVIVPDDPEAYQRARREADDRARPGFFSRLFGARTQADAPSKPPAALELTDGEGDLGDLDKSWHGIHYLLTGTAGESGTLLEFLVAGGTTVGDEDMAYGPPRVFTSAETRAIAAALAAVTDEDLRSRFSPEAMMRAEIYPEIWDRDPEDDDTLGYLMEYVAVLRDAMTAVTSRGHGLLVVLS
jgi:hypothetical protein